ncbi:alpha/beta fold hydrolase [Streptomyces sp. Da 82-17]|uniref:alpha/beta fold hydrolase n=1 Tax=Streptomyces sp. Da 82-17 TaxID=3377116 RepID=UPI0038D4F477
MSSERTHYVTTTDGVTLGATVHGQGPPLVFLQGAVGDGDLDWNRVVERLADRFTCHAPSMRGRGRSGDHRDLSVRRQIDDALDYVDSLGEPVGLVGWSGGANHALGAAARSDAITSVAPFEPVLLGLAEPEQQAVVGQALGRTGALVAEGELADAVRAFLGFPFTEEEIAAADALGYCTAAAPYAPKLLDLLGQVREYGDPTEDPARLGAISVPVTVLVGAATKPVFAAGARHVAEHVPGARVREIPGAGHAAPLTHPEALAAALAEFFTPRHQPA